uniref:Uncharacterized protein n=1 Tax=Steinernema glaseri TaxID=37863 RepID=A0A1I8ACR2_9BILA
MLGLRATCGEKNKTREEC